MDKLRATVKERILLAPGLPRSNPTKAVWQEPPHPTVADVQSTVLPEIVDIIIIGSGITGCAVSHALLSEESMPNLRVTVLEARQTCSGATGRNGGHLVSDCASLVPRLVPELGTTEASKIAKFSEANILRLKKLVSELDETDRASVELRNVVGSAVFEDPDMFSEAQGGLKVLQQVCPDSSIMYQEIPNSDASKKYQYGCNFAGAVEQRGAAALWPYRLITSVFQRLLRDFAERFTLETATAVVSIDYKKDESFPYHVTTQRGVILANQVIHCTNGFAGHLLPKLVGAIYPSRGTMSAQKPHLSFPNLGSEASWTHFSKASFDPETGVFGTGLYYAQQNEHTGEIFIGGEWQKVTDLFSSDDSIVSSEARESLSTILPRVFKGVEPIGEQKIWSGIMGFTSDGLPLVGKLPAEVTERDGDGEWIAAGFNGHGMDKCWLSGETVARMVLWKDTSGLPSAFLLSRERLARSGAEQSVDGFMSMLASA